MSGRSAAAVQGERRNYYLLSVIDVYSRKVLAWLFQGSIRQLDLINLLRRVNLSHELKGVILRNDNGSQFIAHSVRNFLKSSEVKQEFTHVSTPEENSYIEAFPSILEHDVIERNVFDSYYESDGRSRQRNVSTLLFPLQLPSASSLHWFYDTAAEMAGSSVGL